MIYKYCVSILFFATIAPVASAQPLIFDDPTPTALDGFGRDVAIDGNYALIGAWADDTLGDSVGQAHLFDATTGALLHTFNDPTPTQVDYFGNAVAIDGDRVLIGAWEDDTMGEAVGQAHLFDATTGDLLHTFNDPAVTGRDYFGRGVAISGNHVVIGGYGHNDNRFGQVGEVHVFDATTGNLITTLKDPTVTENGRIGAAVAVDGNLAVVGNNQDDTFGDRVGQAYLYDVTNGTLLHIFNDPTVTDRDLFGGSVAIDGNLVAISATGDDTNGDRAGQAHLFDAVTGDLLHTFNHPNYTEDSRFGRYPEIQDNVVFIPSSEINAEGVRVTQVHLFDALSGDLLRTIDYPADMVASVSSFAFDGNRALLGISSDDTFGQNVGRAYLFTHESVPDPVGVRGDANGDENFDFGDIEAFFLALTDPTAYAVQYPGVTISLLDMNEDGNTDFGDIDAFFIALTGG